MTLPRHPPVRVEWAYGQHMQRRLAVLQRMAVQVIRRRPRHDEDAVDEDENARRLAILAAQAVRREIVGLRRAWLAAMPIPVDLLLPLAETVDRFTTREVERAIDRAARVAAIDIEAPGRIGSRTRREMRELHTTWSREGAELITKLERETLDEISELVAQAVANGDTDLGAVLEQRFGIAGRRARLIAADQIGKLNGKITQARQEQFGIVEYTWLTARDQRVRDRHAAREGKRFRWDSPPLGGHPGTEVLCRCVALPVLAGE